MKQNRARSTQKAKDLGISAKRYAASKYDSVGWSYAIEVIRRRCRASGVACSITSKDLALLWKKQLGVCPLTGWTMIKRKTGLGLRRETVTVDRINPSVGYVLDNVRLIAFSANNAKYVWPDDQLIAMAIDLVNQHIKDSCEQWADD